jgi:hypothetical protein
MQPWPAIWAREGCMGMWAHNVDAIHPGTVSSGASAGAAVRRTLPSLGPSPRRQRLRALCGRSPHSERILHWHTCASTRICRNTAQPQRLLLHSSAYDRMQGQQARGRTRRYMTYHQAGTHPPRH